MYVKWNECQNEDKRMGIRMNEEGSEPRKNVENLYFNLGDHSCVPQKEWIRFTHF